MRQGEIENSRNFLELAFPKDYVEDCGSLKYLVQESLHRVDGVYDLKACIYMLQTLRKIYISHNEWTHHEDGRHGPALAEDHRGRAATKTPLERM
jgi:hypothetical protein